MKKVIESIDNFSIRTKLILTVVGIILVLGVLMASYLNVVQTNMMKSELNEKGISITRNLAENSVNPILTDNQVRLQWLVKTIKESESEVVYVFIVDERGEILVHTFSGGFPVDLKGINPADSGTGQLLLDTEKGYIRDISYPILDGSAGEVHVGMSQESIGTTVDKFTQSLLLFVLLLLIVGSNVAYMAGSVVSSPILELKNSVEIFGKGDLDHKARITSQNEIGQLADSFNDMADHIGYLINEKEKAAKEVLETRNYLTKIVSGSLDGIVVIDVSGKVEFANESFMHIAEADMDEIIGLDALSFAIDDEDIVSYFESPDKDSTFMKEMNFRAGNGNLKSIIMSIAVVEYRNELKYVAVTKDITEIKKLEQMKRNIIANISHELRTPLNIMKGYVEIALDETDLEKRNLFLEKSLKALERQNWMIQDLLEVARCDDELEKMDMVKTSINCVVDMAFKALNGKVDVSGLNVNIRHGQDKFVRADPEKLAYALTKIIDNSLKFTEKGGSVEIGTFQDDGKAIVYVKDTGIGIPDDKLELIFDRFYQVDSSSTRKYGGNGLGLNIVKTIVDGHEGKIWVESAVGEGSTFFITVPEFENSKETHVCPI
ncbi:HAMP domain-containing sensor histidine kinase [Methanolobus bombayensis]|uniref:HAMP domain-containing sensor histidine kinase n=1 Tax=Methanolobus bombayensis TaxID=38023 RepID=UPI001AE73E41|nr:ATP-binding protein [Methanolobus bombayensis]MBP1909141.1 two-component system sensor histidine kinase VicK [Methanolobus bombayensis]